MEAGKGLGGGAQQREGGGDRFHQRAQGAVERRQDAQALEDDEVEMIGDLGNEFDDPEGWMSEHPDYWKDLGDPPLPTRAQLLRHRIGEFIALLRSFMPGSAPAWPIERIPETVWRRAAHEVFGPDTFQDYRFDADLRGAAQTPMAEDGPQPSSNGGQAGAKTGETPDFGNPARHAEQVGTTPSDASGIATDTPPRAGRQPKP
ncbi:hypothetical protein DBR47_12355 [Paucibacter sp. KBW04]|uniref:hypothetical protein n=1 Tax=Paucibacter sp. KBW04 TaxID=2153361 RepID=UPI000F57709B|nr:hypothetical protein [Paucibacter sp. KBW04]RQO58497.1 hypothetical protein DBR47_12355 [Paucibacter sp. KBW04]